MVAGRAYLHLGKKKQTDKKKKGENFPEPRGRYNLIRSAQVPYHPFWCMALPPGESVSQCSKICLVWDIV